MEIGLGERYEPLARDGAEAEDAVGLPLDRALDDVAHHPAVPLRRLRPLDQRLHERRQPALLLLEFALEYKAPLLDHPAQDLRHLVGRVVAEGEDVREAALQARVGREEGRHLPLVAREDDHDLRACPGGGGCVALAGRA